LTDIFHEVEEDLRRDRLNKLWSRYGTVFLTVAVLAVLATAGVMWWRGHQAAQAAAAADAFAAAGDAVDASTIDQGIAAFDAIGRQDGTGYPILARFRQAGLMVAKNDLQGALAIYDQIANSGADERLKALARIRAAYAVADIEAPDVLKNRVAPMAADGNPWRFEAREIQGIADLRAGDLAAAQQTFAALAADTAAPDTLRARALKISDFLAGGGSMPAGDAAPVAQDAAPVTTPEATPAPSPADAPQQP